MGTRTTGCAAAVLTLAMVTVATAAPQPIKADLTAKAETPPNGSGGTGSLSGTYDPATRKMTYEVTYSGLTGPATAAHFHAPAPVG
jgi:hypothetical protein